MFYNSNRFCNYWISYPLERFLYKLDIFQFIRLFLTAEWFTSSIISYQLDVWQAQTYFFTSCMSYRLEHYLPAGIPQDRTCFVLPAGLIASPGRILPAECFNSSSSLYLPAGLSPAQTRFPTSLIFLLDLACMFTSCILTSLGNCFLAAGFFYQLA